MAESLQLDHLAGEKLEQALKEQLGGEDVITVSASAWVQANLAQAALYGLIRYLRHRDKINEADLARSIAWAYDERRVRLQEKGRISIHNALPAVTVSGKN
jgi:hypothetical protein